MSSRHTLILASCLMAAGCNVSQILATPSGSPSPGASAAITSPSPSAPVASPTPNSGTVPSTPAIVGTPSPFPTALPVPSLQPTPSPTTYFGPGYPGPPG